MRIFYTNKIIFWSNEGNDYLEKNKFDEYLNDWVELSNTKSVNWPDVYNVNFYSSDNFEATYFKIIKNNFTYYFFIQDIGFVSNNGKQYTLTLDFYNTYTINFIEKLKQENPLVVFKRKHANRYVYDAYNNIYPDIKKLPYLQNVPNYLTQFESYKLPTKRSALTVEKQVWTYDVICGNRKVHISDGQWIESGNNTYYYLKVKRPPRYPDTLKQQDIAKLLNQEVYYFPLNIIPSEISNSILKAQKFPADMVIGMVGSLVPPSRFAAALDAKTFYKGLVPDGTFDLDILLVGNNSINILPITETPFYNYNMNINPNKTDYNINVFNNEPALLMDNFLHFTFNNNNRYSFNYLFYNNNVSDNPFFFGLRYVINTDILVSFMFYNEASLYNNMYKPDYYTSFTLEFPFSGNVFNEYIKNNINSINTGIALKKEETNMKNGWTIAYGVLNMFSALANSLLSGAGIFAAKSPIGKLAAAGSTLNNVKSLITSGMQMTEALQKNFFSLKSMIQRTEALIADVKNKPNKMLDTYGEGVSQLTDDPLVLTTYELPDDYKKLVFADFYFHGYITNTTYKFNEYNNRINFNYFEIGNSYQLASQYLKYPKGILQNIANQVEKGIRLWKTNNFDYTMTLDNKENIYA